MFTLRDLDELAGFAVMNIRTLNSTVLRAIGEKVRLLRKGGKFDKFESQSRFSSDADKLLREIQKEIDIATASIEEVYARVAKIAYRSYAESFLAQGLKQPPIEQERALVNFIQSVAATTKGSFANLSNTTAIGFKLLDPGGRTTFVGFKRHYHNLVDQAVADISTGNESWSGALRNALKQTADSGIRVLDYESGYSRRLDSAMRQNVLDGVKAITTEITARNGEKFGADGWEIDAHNWCAPDHLPFQGRRYTKAEFEEIQEALPRKFETWNCRHTVYAVDLEASTPLYTEEELQKIAATSTEVREFDGREYTAYEATQLQRKLETQIRKHKDRANIAKAAGDDLTRRAEQLRINQLKDKYVELSNRFGLPVAKDRMAVAGFRRVRADIKSVLESKFVRISMLPSDNRVVYEVDKISQKIKDLIQTRSSAEVVKISEQVGNHIISRHKEHFDINKAFNMLPEVINNPQFIYEGKKKNSLQFVESFNEKFYLMVPIKCLPDELWIETLTIEEKARFLRRWGKRQLFYKRK